MNNYEVELNGFVGDGNHDDKILWIRAENKSLVESFLQAKDFHFQKIVVIDQPGISSKEDGLDYILPRLESIDSLLKIAEEIANDPKCDLGNSERRIRLYSAISKAGGILSE